jgi:DnaJ-class molecular chaperone
MVEGDWFQCWNCGGEGELNHYESDPLWYATYEEGWETCDICKGEGGWTHEKEESNV